MSQNFSSSFFKSNRDRLRDMLQREGPIVLAANGLMQRNSDISFPFRQDSNFWYLSGIEEPDLILVIDTADEYLIVPDRDEVRATFDGQADIKQLQAISGIKGVYENKAGWERLNLRIKMLKTVYAIEPPAVFEQRHGIFVNPSKRALQEALRESNKAAEFIDIRKQLADLRMTKQSIEIKAISRAIDTTIDAFKSIKSNLNNFSDERQIQGILNQSFFNANTQHAYLPIVASGKNACTLHYIENRDKLSIDDLILIDAGAEWSNYASDITRTYSYKNVSKRQLSVFSAVKDVQDFAMQNLRPGITIKDYEQRVEGYMGRKLKALGLIDTNKKADIRKYYPHATSHFLGLDTHDMADYLKPLAHDMVLTVEPGIYIPEENIGIRIEDNVVITKDGCRNLSQKLPRNL